MQFIAYQSMLLLYSSSPIPASSFPNRWTIATTRRDSLLFHSLGGSLTDELFGLVGLLSQSDIVNVVSLADTMMKEDMLRNK